MTSVEEVRDALTDVVDPCSAATGSDLDIVEMGLVNAIDISDGHVEVDMRLTTPACFMVAYFHEEINDRVGALPDIESVELNTDDGLSWTKEMMSEEAKQRRRNVMNEHRPQSKDELAIH